METEILHQLIILLTLSATMVLFIWNGLRYDLIALVAFLVILLTGVISLEQAFEGFSHPVVIIVASMFVLGQAVVNSGVVEVITRKIVFLKKHMVFQILTLSALVTIASAFINNLGALAIMVPIAVHMARKSNASPALYLLPLAFASHLGGFLTLIGTPRNIIVSAFRESATGEQFMMFDFIYVGGALAIAGLIFLSLVAWRFMPRNSDTNAGLFNISNYITEVRISENSPLLGKYTSHLTENKELHISIISLIRDNKKMYNLSGYETLQIDDTLLIEGDPESLTELVETKKLELSGKKSQESGISPAEEQISLEAIVSPYSNLIGKTWSEIPLKEKFGVNLLAIARKGKPIREKISETYFKVGDVLIFYGLRQSLSTTISQTGCYPLAERNVYFGRKLSIPLTLTIFLATILAASFSVAPLEVIFLTGAVIMLVLNLIPIKQAYRAIEWPVLISLGAMITIGLALEQSGGAETVASALKAFSQYAFVSPALIVGIVLVISVLMSNFINSIASAVLMSPIAIALAVSLSANPDGLLMAVAIGASCGFITPTAHESNTMVMEPGGYSTKDYIKIGLPMEIIIIVISIPLILYFWPLF